MDKFTSLYILTYKGTFDINNNSTNSFYCFLTND